MRNTFKGFFYDKTAKFQVVKFNPSGHNAPIKLNLFSNAVSKKDSIFNGILVPTFDNKSFYSNFTYKYFNLKWKKFEQKSNYYRYIKSPSSFPNFLTFTNYFTNSFLTRRRKRRIYKRRKTRYSAYFANRFIRSTRSTLRSYALVPFWDNNRVRISRIKKYLLRPLAKKKKITGLFKKYWFRHKWNKNPKKLRKLSFKKRIKALKTFYRYKRFYFKRRSYRFKVFRFFNFRRNYKKIRYSRRYAFKKFLKFRKKFKNRRKLLFFRQFFSYAKSTSFKKIRNIRFFKRLVKKSVKRQFFMVYLRYRANFRVRSRIFSNRFGALKFIGFKNYLITSYFFSDTPIVSSAASKKKISKFLNSKFFSYFFLYPQKINYSQNSFYFKFFSTYNLLKNTNFKRFKIHFNLNFKQYYYFFKNFKKFFCMVSPVFLNFIPFRFKNFKKNYRKKFKSRIIALQYIQRRKFIRNLRFSTYFALFCKLILIKRNTKFYRKIIKKILKFVYKRCKFGRIPFFLPFVFNKFFYFGLLSHLNSNIYNRDPFKFNDFYSTKTRRNNRFVLRTKI